MRYLFILTLFIGLTFKASAQNEPSDFSVSFLITNGLQPGFKLGTHLPLKIKISDRDDGAEIPNHRLYLKPQVGFFSDIDKDMNYFVGGEFGKIFDSKRGENNKSIGLQIGYLRQSIKESFGVSLGSGNTSSENRVGRNFLLTGMAYSHRWMTKNKKRLWTKATLGRKFRTAETSSFIFQIEFGTTINFKVSENE